MEPLTRNDSRLACCLVSWFALAAPVWAALSPADAQLAPGSFASLEDALAAAVARVHARSVREDREHLGGLFAARDGSAFVYSVAAGSSGHDELSVRLRAPAGFHLAAVWHTHGAPGAGRSFFSARDTALAQRLGVPIYLATPAGALRVFHPDGRTLSPAQARRRKLGWRVGLSAGLAVASGARGGVLACDSGAASASPAS
jgi:hypothetical protein